VPDRPDPDAPPPLVRLERPALKACVDVLSQAFGDYPVLTYLVGDTGSERAARLRRLVEFFVTARFLWNEPVLGAERSGALVGTALVSLPDRGAPPAELADRRSELWEALGPEARERYEALGRVWSAFDPGVPHLHLNMVGVRASHRGTGIGRLLIDAVRRLSREHPTSRGVTLTTETAANVPFYERLGFDLIWRDRVTPELETFGFFRPDDGPG
jgi:GNAT superfamily N-acetyltransferase